MVNAKGKRLLLAVCLSALPLVAFSPYGAANDIDPGAAGYVATSDEGYASFSAEYLDSVAMPNSMALSIRPGEADGIAKSLTLAKQTGLLSSPSPEVAALPEEGKMAFILDGYKANMVRLNILIMASPSSNEQWFLAAIERLLRDNIADASTSLNEKAALVEWVSQASKKLYAKVYQEGLVLTPDVAD